MANIRNTSRTFKSGGSDINSVINDYKAFVEKIRKHSEEKVEEAVSTITNNTNRGYSGLPPEEATQLSSSPIYYKMYGGKNIISGAAIAKPIKEFIYLEFGTRQSDKDSISIATGFKSGIDTNAIAAPYKSNKVPFFNNKASGGNYIFLGNIDIEGVKFLKNFWK
jgi:hypothetical protein